MIDRTRYVLAAALLLAPLAARAQQPSHAAPRPAPAPTVASAEESFPDDAIADAGMWFDDDLLAFGLGDGFYLDGGGLAGDDAGVVNGSPGTEETRRSDGQPNGPPPGPGGMGMGMRQGMGMGHGMGQGMRRGYMSGRPMMHGGMPLVMRIKLAQLDLSAAQRDKLRDLHEAHARKAILRRADLQLARMDLHRLMRADKPDAGAVNSQIDKLARLHADGLKAMFEVRMQARAVLTPEQIKQLHGPMDPMMMHPGMLDSPDSRPKR